MMKTVNLARRYQLDLLGLLILMAVILAAGLLITRSYYLSMLVYAGIYAIAALGMFILFGYAGQISIGQAAFFGIGAYTSALVVMHSGLPSIVAIGCSVALAAAFGWLVSRPLLRLATNYLALATLAFGLICFSIFGQWSSLTGGLDPGIVAMPSFNILGLTLSGTRAIFWLVAVCFCLCMFLTLNIVHSRIGRALRALKSSEVAASGLGIDVVGYKVAAFTFAAGLTGLAGALFAFFQNSFNASVFGVGLSIELLVMVVVGSVSSPWGALFGALFVTILPSFLEDYEHYKLLVYGIILTFIMIFMPDGLGRSIVLFAGQLYNRVRSS
jgi:branched-chain amino acid transport system permease protein